MNKAHAENQPQTGVNHASELSSKRSQPVSQPTALRQTLPERVPMVQLEHNLAWVQTAPASALPIGQKKGTELPEGENSRHLSSVKRSGSSTSRAWSYSAVNSGFSTSRNRSPGI